MAANPYVVGQWVRGKKFYGRPDLIQEILHGNRNWLWLLGTRRIGKTSVLKQVEHLAASDPDLGYFPLFWDFQGSESLEELHLSFGDSLLDAEERMDEIGIDPKDVEADDLFRSLGKLRRKLRANGTRLLVLCDEVEELIKLNEKEPSLLRKLRRAFQSQEDIRSVLASTIRLWALADERGDTSPFLHGFSPPLYIHNLADDDARALIAQANLPSDSQPRFDDKDAETIRTHCDNHPYLIQLLCKRHLELEDLDEAVEQVATDPMVSFFFSVDFEMLSGLEHDILRIIAEQDSSTSNSIATRLSGDPMTVGGSLHRLQHLGYVRKDGHGRFVLVNYFFRRWFKNRPLTDGSQPHGPGQLSSSSTSTLTMQTELEIFDDRYRLIERVGEGAMGVVYKAHDTMLRVDIALKQLKPQFAGQEDALERLRREVLLARDIGHPNVVNIYHLGEFHGTKYLTMQWVGGPTLAQVIKDEAPFPTDRVLALAGKLAGALAAAHARNVLHRDIKPLNILLDENGDPQITDFGLARLVDGPGMTKHGVFLGTPSYAAPEQIAFRPLDERSDIYALGVVMFEMATGSRPFDGTSVSEVLQKHAEVPPPDPRTLYSEVDSDLSSIILRCLEKDPARRFQTARGLQGALHGIGPDQELG